MKYLGVTAARDYLWNSLVNTLVSKCNIMMSMTKRSVVYKTHINVTPDLYRALVCRNLTHCSMDWFPLYFLMKYNY